MAKPRVSRDRFIPILDTLPSGGHPTTHYLWHGDVSAYLTALEPAVQFDLIVTSPPYNLGKPYETARTLDEYLKWQASVIEQLAPRVKDTGSICWQVGNYVSNGSIWPLDIDIAPMFRALGLQLRNRIVWRFGHGLHSKRRFSGRYEVILWFTRTDRYKFNLNAVRVPSKYPGKKHYKGPKQGEYSANPKGKNPEDVWDIPNVKANHVEKTLHPSQFPVGLIERLVLALTDKHDWVFDPFAGVASAGVAAAIHGRYFSGCDTSMQYLRVGRQRIFDALQGHARYRPHDRPIYDHTTSRLSLPPDQETTSNQ